MRVRLKGLVMMLVVVGEGEVISEPENPTLKCQPPSNWAESYPTAMKTRAACFCITTVRASSQSWHPCGVIQSERGQFSFVQWGVGQSREHLDIWSSGHFATTSLVSQVSQDGFTFHFNISVNTHSLQMQSLSNATAELFTPCLTGIV